MKIEIMSKDGTKKVINCESFDFDSGFLKIIGPDVAPNTEGQVPSEIYVPAVGSLVMIQNFGAPRKKEESKDEPSKQG